jgi:flagellar protein FliS
MNNYQKYHREAIFSMSPCELLVLLYDECMKDLRKAQFSLEDGSMDSFDNYINKAVKIIRYLSNTLRMDQPVSRDLRRLYDYLTFDLGKVKAGGKRYMNEIPKLVDIIQDLRDGFEGAGRQVADTHMATEERVLV